MQLPERTQAIIEKPLRKGAVIHAFLSGGGLRVLRLERGRHGPLDAYAEHPHVGEAFRHLADDIMAGGREYSAVYGGTEPHYLTGDPKPESELDAWLRQGSTFDARVEGDEFVFELHGFESQVFPKELVERVAAGETLEWRSERGVLYLAEPVRYASGRAASSWKTIERPEGMKPFNDSHWNAVRTGRGATLNEAMAAAFAAPKVEVPG